MIIEKSKNIPPVVYSTDPSPQVDALVNNVTNARQKYVNANLQKMLSKLRHRGPDDMGEESFIKNSGERNYTTEKDGKEE